MTMVARTRAELAEFRSSAIDRSGSSVAVVMTMGALHAGHAELIRQARERADVVIVTDFLNPLQFAPGEDLDKYPRTFAADLTLCESEQVDVLFAPMPDVIYPVGEPLVRVAAGLVGDVVVREQAARRLDVRPLRVRLTRQQVAHQQERQRIGIGRHGTGHDEPRCPDEHEQRRREAGERG